MQNLLAQSLGQVAAPDALPNPDPGIGIANLLQTALNVLLVVAGIYALFNFVLAGYAFLGAGDDPGKIQGAWSKIYQSIIGLLFAAGSLVIAAIVGQLIFGSPTFLLNPTIPTP